MSDLRLAIRRWRLDRVLKLLSQSYGPIPGDANFGLVAAAISAEHAGHGGSYLLPASHILCSAAVLARGSGLGGRSVDLVHGRARNPRLSPAAARPTARRRKNTARLQMPQARLS